MLLCCSSLFQVVVAIFPGQCDKDGYLRMARWNEDFVPTEMKHFDTGAKSWKPFPSMARLVDARECTCAEVVGNYLFVAIKKEDSSTIFRRYHAADNVWETLLI